MISKILSVAAILIACMSSASADYSSPIFKDLDVRGVVKLPGTGYTYANAGGAVTYSTTIPNSGLAFLSITIAGHIVPLGGAQAIACGDLSNGATGCSTAIGTSGATLPLLSTANTWTLAQTYSAAPIFTTLNGYLRGNGAGALTASAAVPSADFADGNTGTGAVAHAESPSFTTLSASGQFTSTVATGTPPFVVASASKVISLYADRAALADTVTTNANLTGDVTSVGNATTIAANAVTNAKSAQMAATSFKCNNTGGSANPIDCTAAQATAMLNVMVGDSGSGGVKGLVAAPAAGDAAAGKVWGASGSWVVPTASGTQNANMIYSGPASGAAASPSFRAQVCADLPPGAWCLLNTLTASNSASLSDTTSFTSSYHEYELVFENIVPSTNSAAPNMQLHTGGAYQNTNYVSSCIYANTASSGTCGSITTYIFVCAGGIANSSPGCSGSIRASNLSQTTSPKVWSGQFVSVPTSNVPIINSVGGYWNGGNGAIDGFQILMSSGNIASGTIKIYGRKL